MEDSSLNFQVEDLVLPFLPYSTVEHWLVATDSEEISLVLSEMIDMYSSLDESVRKQLDPDKIHNVVYTILKNIANDDNTVRLQALRILRLIVEDHATTLSDISTFFFTACHDLIQDVSRVIRNSALKLLSTIVANINFGIISSAVTGLLESTYQYHEYSLRACSLAVLHFLAETQIPNVEGEIYNIFTDSIIDLAASATAILLFSSEQIKKITTTKNCDTGDSEDPKKESSAFFSTYEAAIDLFALCTVAKSVIENISKNSKNRSITSIRQASSTQMVEAILSQINSNNNIKFPGKTQSEITQRIRSFVFPSLSDEVIHDLSDRIISELNSPLKTSSNESILGLKVRDSLMVDTSIDSNSSSICTSQELSESMDTTKLNSLKSTRKSMMKSHSSKKQVELLDLTFDRGAFSADGGARFQSNNSPQLEAVSQNNFMSTIQSNTTDETTMNSTIGGGDGTVLPTQCHTPNSNYSRAANVRSKRTKLKTPLKLEAPTSFSEKATVEEALECGIIIVNSNSLPDSLDSPNVKSVRSVNMSFSHSSDSNDGAIETARSRASVFSTAGNGASSPNRVKPIHAVSLPGENSDNPHHHNHKAVNPSDSQIAKGTDGFDYLETKDIVPLKNPTSEFQKAAKGLETQDWPELFATLNTIRSSVLHHSAMVVNSGLLHSLIRLIMKQVENLRSSLAKNALLTIADCFEGLGKQLDPEVNVIAPGLLKRAGDSSVFLSDSADRALEKMIEHVSVHRSLACLLIGLETRSSSQRKKASYFLYLLTKWKPQELTNSKEFESFKNRMIKLLQDSSPESRGCARGILKELLTNGIVTKQELEFMNLSSELIEKILKDKVNLGSLTPKGSFNSAGFRSFDGMDYSSAGDYSAISSYRSASPNFEEEEDHSHVYQPASHLKGKSPARPRHAVDKDAPLLKTPPRTGRRRTPDGINPEMERIAGLHVRQPSPHAVGDDDHYKELGIANTSTKKPTRHAHLPSEQEGNLTPARRQKLSNSNEGSNYQPSAHNNNTNTTTTTAPRSPRNRGGNTNALTAAKRMMDSDPDLLLWQNTVMNISTSKQLNEKKDALTFMSQLIMKHSSVLRDCGKLESSLDCILDRLTEGSLKIVIHAMDLFETIFQQHQHIVLQCNVLQFIAQSYYMRLLHPIVNQRGSQLLKLLIQTLSPIQVAQYLCHVSELDSDKLRVAALKMLMELIDEYCQEEETVHQVVRKIIFVSMCKNIFAEASKVEIRLAACDVIKSIQNNLKSEKIWKWTESAYQQDEIKRITSVHS